MLQTLAYGSTHSTATSHIQISGLKKAFGSYKAIDDVHFSVEAGHTLGLLGPSGCGKTTILRCLAGLETPDSGYINLGGITVFDSENGINLPPEKRELGIVFQSYAVWPHMTVAENVGFPLKVRGVDKETREKRVRELLEIVGLSDFMTRSATQMSGGQQQRVALARALIHQPKLVLFDEALSNLDAQLREHMRVELNLLQQKLGFTAIYVTHDQSEAFGLAEKIVLMNRGRIETAGPARNVFRQPHSAFAAQFFGLNVASGTVVSMESGYAEVDLGQGTVVRGRFGDAQGLTPGAQAVVGMRREQIRLMPLGESESSSQALPGLIEASSFQGLNEELVVTVGGTRLRVIQPLSELCVNDRVSVLLRQDEVFVFPPAQ